MCAMMNLDVRALQAAQVAVALGEAKAFQISLGDEDFIVWVNREGGRASHTRPAEKAEAPSLNECAEVIAEMFRRMISPARADRTDGRNGTYPMYPQVERLEARKENLKQGMSAWEWAERYSVSIFPEMPVEDEDDGEDVLWGPLDVSERADGPGEVDVEAGWEAYRREIAETMGPTILPAWSDAPAQLKECFSAGIWAALEPVAAKGVVQSLREEKERLERVIARHWEVTSKEMKGGAQ